MSENSEIIKPLQHLINVWEGKESNLNACLTDEPFIYMNMFNNMYTGDDLKAALKKPAGSDLKIEICNHTAVTECDAASQYATIIGLFTKEGSPFMHLAFGGTFVNKLVRKNGEWKLSVIRFNLQIEDSTASCRLLREGMIHRSPGYGSRSFIAGWKTIDDRIGHNMAELPNMGARMISPDYDIPWYAVRNSDNALSDTEMVKEIMYKFTCGFDLAAFHLMSDAFSENFKLNLTGEEFTGRRNAIGYLKMLRKSTPRAHNSLMIEEVNINNSSAVLKASRIAPDLRNLRKVTDDFRQWKDGTYTLKAEKKDGCWKAVSLVYTKEGA